MILSFGDGKEKLFALCLEHLTKIIPDAKEKFPGANVLKTPIVYPVFLNEYEQARKGFEQSTGVENLLSIGRSGEFAHIIMEDVCWRTGRKVGHLIENR